MALTKKDLGLIKELLGENNKELYKSFRTEWRNDLHAALTQQSQDIKRDIRDEMDARFLAFENKINKEFVSVRKEMNEGFLYIAEIITDRILPEIHRIDQNTLKIQTFVGMTS